MINHQDYFKILYIYHQMLEQHLFLFLKFLKVELNFFLEVSCPIVFLFILKSFKIHPLFYLMFLPNFLPINYIFQLKILLVFHIFYCDL